MLHESFRKIFFQKSLSEKYNKALTKQESVKLEFTEERSKDKQR